MGKGHCDSVMNILKSHGIHNQSLEDELAQLCETFFDEYELGCYYTDGEEVAEAMGRSEEEIAELKEGHSLIYKSLRGAEGIKELMTGPEFECIAESVEFYIQGFHEKDDEIQKLKEENEKWEYWASEVIHWSHSASKDNLQAKNLITPDNKPTIGDVRDFGEEIQKLKEENEELKKMMDDVPFCDGYTPRVFIEKLKKEIEELKEQLEKGYFKQFGESEVWSHCQEFKELKEENKKLKGYLGEVGTLLDDNIVEDNQDPPVTTIYADAFDKLTNNEFV